MVTLSLLDKGPPPCLVLPRSSPPPSRRTLSFCCASRRPSSSLVDETVARIQSSGVIACLRANSAELAVEAACAALTGGISVLEIIVSTPGVFEALQQLVHDYPTMVLGVIIFLILLDFLIWGLMMCFLELLSSVFYKQPGILQVGTVLSVEDAKKALRVGAKFLMSPAIVKDVMDGFQSGELLYIPGAMTPTEILSAHDAGAKMVKVYPVSALGGVKYISAIKKPFPHISMVASQGITIDSIGEYIANGASSVVLSDAVFDKEAMSQKNFEVIHKLAHFAALQGKEAVERRRCCR